MSLSLHKTNLTVYQAVHPWICSEGCVFMQLQKVAWDGDQIKADGRHLEEVFRKLLGHIHLELFIVQLQEGPTQQL